MTYWIGMEELIEAKEEKLKEEAAAKLKNQISDAGKRLRKKLAETGAPELLAEVMLDFSESRACLAHAVSCLRAWNAMPEGHVTGVFIYKRVINTIMQFLNQCCVNKREEDNRAAVEARSLTNKGRAAQDLARAEPKPKIATVEQPGHGQLHSLLGRMQDKGVIGPVARFGQLRNAADDTVYKPPHNDPNVDMKLLREEAVLLLNELCFPRGQGEMRYDALDKVIGGCGPGLLLDAVDLFPELSPVLKPLAKYFFADKFETTVAEAYVFAEKSTASQGQGCPHTASRFHCDRCTLQVSLSLSSLS